MLKEESSTRVFVKVPGNLKDHIVNNDKIFSASNSVIEFLESHCRRWEVVGSGLACLIDSEEDLNQKNEAKPDHDVSDTQGRVALIVLVIGVDSGNNGDLRDDEKNAPSKLMQALENVNRSCLPLESSSHASNGHSINGY